MTNYIVREYTLLSSKINKEYNILGIADIHFNNFINSKFLSSLKNLVINSKYDLILISGDIMNSNMYLNNKSFNKVKSILDNISILGKCPIYISLGNHDINTKHLEEVIKRFESLKYNTNLFPLSNETINFNDLTISGITVPIEAYDRKNIFNENGFILNNVLSSLILEKYGVV